MKKIKPIKCPHNYQFGIDTERYDACDTCKIFDNCLEKKKIDPPNVPRRGRIPETEKPEQEEFNYAKLLKHPKWQRRRLEIMLRDDFTCRLCQDTETTLHVHHKKYESGKKPWEYEDDDLITLCEDCHDIIEFFKEEIPEITSYKIIKYSYKSGDSLLFLLVSSDAILSCRKNQEDKHIDFHFHLKSKNAISLTNHINKHINISKTEG